MIVVRAVDINGESKDTCTRKPLSKEHCLYCSLEGVGDKINGIPQAWILENYVSPISTNGTKDEWCSHLGEFQR